MSDLLTWVASVLCALGVLLISVDILKQNKAHFVISHPIFLPLYSAGILQWLIWGIRSNDLALILPTAFQILFLILLLKRWWTLRLSS